MPIYAWLIFWGIVIALFMWALGVAFLKAIDHKVTKP